MEKTLTYSPLPRVKRTASGIRDFDEEACEWVEFIKCMRDCGVQIAPLTEYVSLYFEEGTEQQRLDILREQCERLFRQRADLDAIIARLDAKIGHYESVIDEQ
ncbi:MerR family transcriptional regulator [Selenomonas sp. oral taxon 126]|uniref:MerR family transcriptional regulator n=1 Tax=Selenomonas sp. oral taxon 126 TaxID=712528 RepID=UPI001C12C340|nr:MerR family transcriptional regulator [Selenomonas sp. oral taxon 126]